MTEMDDEEFLSYCATHSETQRCGFVPAQISRLLRLAGDEAAADLWSNDPNAVHDCDRYWVREQVEAARLRAIPTP